MVGRGPQTMDGSVRVPVVADAQWTLVGGRCVSCGALSYPLPLACSRCGADCVSVELDTRGRVGAATQVWRRRPDVVLDVPYQIALVAIPGPGALTVRVPCLEKEPLQSGELVDLRPLRIGDAGEGQTVVGVQAIRAV